MLTPQLKWYNEVYNYIKQNNFNIIKKQKSKSSLNVTLIIDDSPRCKWVMNWENPSTSRVNRVNLALS